jgi:hypothetical protein
LRAEVEPGQAVRVVFGLDIFLGLGAGGLLVTVGGRAPLRWRRPLRGPGLAATARLDRHPVVRVGPVNNPVGGRGKRPRAVGLLAALLVPLVAHQPRPAEEPLNLRHVAAGPVAQQVAQGQVGGTVVAAIVGGVPRPQPAEPVPIGSAAGATQDLVVREGRGPLSAPRRLFGGLLFLLGEHRPAHRVQAVRFGRLVDGTVELVPRHREVAQPVVHLDEATAVGALAPRAEPTRLGAAAPRLDSGARGRHLDVARPQFA